MEEGPTGTIEQPGMTGPSGDTGPIQPVIRLSEILTEQTVLLEKEANDTQTLAGLVTPNLSDIRAKLVAWAARKFAPPCDLIVVTINPPSACSDGVSRNLFEYIQFLTGKTLQEHMDALQLILPDFYVTYLQEGTILKVGVVTR